MAAPSPPTLATSSSKPCAKSRKRRNVGVRLTKPKETTKPSKVHAYKGLSFDEIFHRAMEKDEIPDSLIKGIKKVKDKEAKK
jgi:hypothetical protein